MALDGMDAYPFIDEYYIGRHIHFQANWMEYPKLIQSRQTLIIHLSVLLD
jgi:hypothetical protein